MIISDLNHLEVFEGTKLVGGITNGSTNQLLTYTEVVNVIKNVNSSAHVTGNLAFAEGDATAIGSNTLSQSLTTTNVVQGIGSSASSTSISATNGAGGSWHP